MPIEAHQIVVISNAEIAEKKQLLESTFERIYRERMADVPITNDTIEINAVGFQQWKKSYLGVLVTPWFMNIMLLPGPTEDWQEMQELSTNNHIFPSGRYAFTTGYEPDIGKYQMCSLFSPMYDFADNIAALDTASVIIKELMNSENVEETDIDSRQIEKIWNGEETLDGEEIENAATSSESAQEEIEPPAPTIKEKMNAPMSRRELLRGTFMMDDDKQ